MTDPQQPIVPARAVHVVTYNGALTRNICISRRDADKLRARLDTDYPGNTRHVISLVEFNPQVKVSKMGHAYELQYPVAGKAVRIRVGADSNSREGQALYEVAQLLLAEQLAAAEACRS